jgi:cysteinyl-tRNA synthetase
MPAAPFRLYNTLSRSVEDFAPLQPGQVSLYVCGMTVYDEAHVGHARAMVVFDTVVRYLRHRGWKVQFVRNFTDVDDKIINRAIEAKEDPLALAQRYVDAFRRDAEGLGLIAPDVEPRVTESIEPIVAMIDALVTKGHAYVQDGSVWFAVESAPHYGELSGQKVDQLRSADVGNKRNAADFALWKAAKPGEPAWESPWGPGRPGWHIECSAMSRIHLGDQMDIHGGGLDLVFPHHENEVAQSECATGHRPFARYWMHNGLLTVTGGQKMGKSLGNVVNIHALLDRFPAEALRLYYLQNHYRSPLPWNEDALPEALAMLARLYDAREQAEGLAGDDDPERVIRDVGKEAREVYDLGRTFEQRYYATMDEDFNTAAALGLAFELARAINRFAHLKPAKKRGGSVVAPALRALGLLRSIGLLQLDTATFQEQIKQKRLAALGIDRAQVEKLLQDRLAARAAKDWATADALRVQLDAMGVVVMDRAEGVDWRVRLEPAAS